MKIRVLHIFAPNYKHRFGGPIFDWKFAFGKWNQPQVQHLVLDFDQNSPLEAKQAFSFEMSAFQYQVRRKDRLLWIFRLIRLLRKYRSAYDVIHFHILWWGCLFAAAWAKEVGIPTVYQSVLLGSDTPSPIREEKLGWIKARLLKSFTAILPISDALSEDYYAHGYSREQVITLMNSVDTDVFHPVVSQREWQALRQKYSLPLDATILLFTGSIIHRKGVDILIKSFIEVSQRFPGLFLLLVGSKDKGENPSLDEAYVQGLQKQVHEKQLDDQVKFAGLVKDREEMAEICRAADLFVFPSRNEGLPNVVLEAMASGLPLVVSDLPGLKPVVNHRENGWVVSIDNINALTSGILHLLENAETASKLGRCARAHVENLHSFSAWQTELVEIYNNLIGKKF